MEKFDRHDLIQVTIPEDVEAVWTNTFVDRMYGKMEVRISYLIF